MTIQLYLIFLEAAVRSQKQAESEDCERVDIEHFEKILPQLVCEFSLPKRHFSVCRRVLNDARICIDILYCH